MLETHQTRFDILGIDRAGQNALVVEAKPLSGFNAGETSAYRRNLLAHIPTPAGTFFLIVSRTKQFLWKSMLVLGAAPDVVVSLPLNDPMLQMNTYENSRSGEGLEILVAGWLNDLVSLPKDLLKTLPSASWSWMVSSGLWTALHGGFVQIEVDA